MREPTDEELREYADKLPAIYRDILAAFPAAEPMRRVGDALIEEAIEDYIVKSRLGHRLEDVWAAMPKLVDNSFIQKNGCGGVQPTPLGERLIRVVTGHEPYPAGIPDLPVPTWG